MNKSIHPPGSASHKLSPLSRLRKNFAEIFRPEQKDLEDDSEPDYKPLDWKLVRRQFKWLLPYKKYYALGCTVGLVHIFSEMLGPKFTQYLIDYVVSIFKSTPVTSPWFLTYADISHWPQSPGQTGQIEHLVGVTAIWLLVTIISMVMLRWTILLMTWAGEKVQFDVRRKLFSHLQTLSMSYYDKTKLGRIISRCTSDVAAMREVNVWGIWQVIANAMMVAVSAFFLLQTDWRLFLAVCWLGPVIYMLNVFYKMRAMVLQQISREGYTRLSTNLAENITGMRVVMAFNRQVPNLQTFNALQDRNTTNNVNVARVNGVYQPLLQIVGFLGRVIILTYGGYLVVVGVGAGGRPITVGAVVACYLYWDWFMNPIIGFGNFYTSAIMPGMVGTERILNLLDTKPDVVDVPDAKPLPRISGHVQFENVTFGYKADRPVLHEVNFNVTPGTTTALVGATGSGKSSIISLIARFYQPQGGRVLVDGNDIRFSTGDSLHQQMGLVLQVNYLFTGTVLDNIRYAKPQATREQIIEAAKALGTYDIISSLNNGFDTEVGERGANMSLGQRQLICFTRAYLSDPRIFMLDEATSSVDTATEMIVQKSLERLLRGRTTFIVAHRLSTIMKADQILVIDAGRIIERGTHRELLYHGGKYAHLYHEFSKQSE
jgi:ATP-binding cassette, subfamily B, bacterial